jgi:two-component system, chemotaxis family, chemotaxis protein CheY
MARILIVDDAVFARMRCAKMLSEKGFEIEEASNGAEALSKYREHKPDAVLLDITMPDMDGITALKEIIRHDPSAKVAMVSAMGQKAMVVEALEFGARDFVMKPFDATRVMEAVDKLLAGEEN